MLDTALNLMVNNVVATATIGKEIPKLGNEAASRAPSSGSFDTADGSVIALAANNERQFVDFCRALGHPEWSEDPRWNNAAIRRENHEALRVEIQQVFMTKPAEHWEILLDEAGVPASRVRTINELLSEGQPAARGLLTELKVGDADTPLQLPGIGFRLNGDSLTPQRAPRKVGADNDKWLSL
jgi:crotonobetainyl-CoA:carnitine CoA-transferase CaiB-like acyl-CoA transferase